MVITHGGPARGFKMCRCAGCKVEAICTPQFDFYTLKERDGDGTGPLYCYPCLCEAMGLPPAKISLQSE